MASRLSADLDRRDIRHVQSGVIILFDRFIAIA
jgi:hypothetical protein